MSLHEYLDKQERVNDDRFKVDDDQKANWALRKIKQLQKDIDNTNKIVDSEIFKFESFRAKKNKTREDKIEHFQNLLAEYALLKREQDPKFKSLKLPNGSFGFRKRLDKWEYNDEKLIKSLEQAELNDLIRVIKEPKKRDLRKHLVVMNNMAINPETGEVIDGIQVVEQGENFNVKVD